MRAAAAAALALLAACTASAPPHPMPPASVGTLSLTVLDPGAERVELNFKDGGKPDGVARIDKGESVTHAVTARRGARPPCKIDAEYEAMLTRVTAAGTVDLGGRGDEQLFLLSEDGGTGSHDEIMLLVDPRDCGVAGLAVTVFHQATHPTTPEAPLGRFKDLERRPERQFLNAIKYRYGYVGKDDAERGKDDPRFAYYYWAQDNGALEEGVMKVRRYKGKPAFTGSRMAELTDGSVQYSAEFKAGVVAYDSAKDEHWILYHPQDMYHWPHLLRFAGQYLLIGTGGEGLAVVNLKTLALKRYRFEGTSDAIVRELAVRGSEVIVNGGKKLTLPGL